MILRCSIPLGLAISVLGTAAYAQDSTSSKTTLDTVFVTVTRGLSTTPLDAPFAMTVLKPDSARPGQRHTALDESLSLVPGLTAVNRTNPSQDPRISIRGFGARSTFGVRPRRKRAPLPTLRLLAAMARHRNRPLRHRRRHAPGLGIGVGKHWRRRSAISRMAVASLS